MKTLVASSFLALATLAPLAAAEPAPRAYVAAVHLAGAEALRIDWTSPRMTATELAKAIADAGVLAALNDKHLADLGTLTALRPCMIGDQYLEAGPCRIGLRIGQDALELRLTGAGGTTVSVPCIGTRVTEPHVPQVAAAFLAREALDGFDLEVRFGALAGRVALSFAAEDVVLGMNNRAFELLSRDELGAGGVRSALELATRANDLTGGRVPAILDTLALARFRSGDVAGAIQEQQRAIAALGADRTRLRTTLEEQLARFQNAARNE